MPPRQQRVETNAGLWYDRESCFSLAIAAWEDAWKTGRAQSAPSPEARALGDRAVGEHLPSGYVDAAGQTTDCAKNAAGRLTSEANALAQVTYVLLEAAFAP